jgi:3-hydroxyacyl-[acyl-carrier-protein] dehydratase
MRFHLIDRIEELTPRQRVTAIKTLTLGEEYLADHFPTFPIMPGVLMLEALVQAGAWLWRVTTEFSHSVIVLREAKGIRYGNLVEPGKELRLAVEIAREFDENAQSIEFKGNGEVAGQSTVSARFTLARYNLADREPALVVIDDELRRRYRTEYLTLRPR